PREPGERREARRGPDPLEVHVGEPGDGVVCARPHVRVPRWIHVALRQRSAGTGAEPGRPGGLPLEHPLLGAAANLHDLRAGLAHGLGQPALPHVTMLDEVVVDGDEPHLVGQHVLLQCSWTRADPVRIRPDAIDTRLAYDVREDDIANEGAPCTNAGTST